MAFSPLLSSHVFFFSSVLSPAQLSFFYFLAVDRICYQTDSPAWCLEHSQCQTVHILFHTRAITPLFFFFIGTITVEEVHLWGFKGPIFFKDKFPTLFRLYQKSWCCSNTATTSPHSGNSEMFTSSSLTLSFKNRPSTLWCHNKAETALFSWHILITSLIRNSQLISLSYDWLTLFWLLLTKTNCAN